MQEIIDDVKHLVGTQGTVTRALSGMLEVLPFGISKANALKQVLESEGVLLENVMAAGDGENDVAMLQAVGVRHTRVWHSPPHDGGEQSLKAGLYRYR